MPLVQAQLEASLLALFLNPPRDLAQTAYQTAKAYADYALSASAVPVPAVPVFTGAEQTLMQQAFQSAWGNPRVCSPASAATVWANALTVFWTAPPILFTAGADSGAPVVFPGAAGVISSLTTLFSNPRNTAQVAAAGVASAAHIATLLTPFVLLPSGTPVTIL